MLKVHTIVNGELSENCYLGEDEDTKECVIVDPGSDAHRIVHKIEELGLTPRAILVTHYHYDHVNAVDDIREEYGIEVYSSEAERDLLGMCYEVQEHPAGRAAGGIKSDHYLNDTDTFVVMGRIWKLLLTPGHTKGSCCYLSEADELMFSGDTLFHGTYGRTDLYSGDAQAMHDSLINKLFLLPDAVKAYPGHGMRTSIGREKTVNPILFE